ncbi:MAG: porin [Oleiphilaceae bacterium]|nr:porin [Oleiphilaceae bacterium]
MNTNNKRSIAKSFKMSALAAGVALVGGTFATTASAAFELESDSGWKVGFNGHIPVFAVLGDFDTTGPNNTEEDSFRITTGFNPATLQTNVYAPSQYGLDVSGHFQMNASLATGDAAGEFRSRVSEIAVAGDFGTVNIGKGFGIFGVPAIGDNGSGLGVGLIAGGPPQVGATAGRIGHGYFYADFDTRVMYTSNNLGGLQFKVGAFTPKKFGSGSETATPRIEANVVYSTDMFSVWTSGFTQDVDSNGGGFEDFTMSGIDFGGSVSVAGLGVRANYSTTQGTGNGIFGGHGLAGAQEEDASQWYVEGTYTFGRTTLGASYGEGEDDLFGDGADSDLTMIFARYAATDALTLMAEIQDHSAENEVGVAGPPAGAFVVPGDYSAVIAGAQLTF